MSRLLTLALTVLLVAAMTSLPLVAAACGDTGCANETGDTGTGGCGLDDAEVGEPT